MFPVDLLILAVVFKQKFARRTNRPESPKFRDKTRRAVALRGSVQTASAQSAPSARRLMEEEKEEVEEADAGAALGASCLGPPLLFLRVLLFLRRLPTVAQASSKGCSAPAGGGTGAALSVAPGAAGAAPSIPVPASKSAVSDGSSVDASSSAFASELGAASRGACSAPTTHTAGASWVGLRATTPDHLPLTGWRRENLGVLTGLGSKGYLYAPILASCLVAEAMGLPLPLERWVWEALHPVRHNPQET